MIDVDNSRSFREHPALLASVQLTIAVALFLDGRLMKASAGCSTLLWIAILNTHLRESVRHQDLCLDIAVNVANKA